MVYGWALVQRWFIFFFLSGGGACCLFSVISLKYVHRIEANHKKNDIAVTLVCNLQTIITCQD